MPLVLWKAHYTLKSQVFRKKQVPAALVWHLKTEMEAFHLEHSAPPFPLHNSMGSIQQPFYKQSFTAKEVHSILPTVKVIKTGRK